MMAAAHPNDLVAAAACGLRTGYIARTNEQGRPAEYVAPKESFDVSAADVEELAQQLGV